jgi:hypothetical protein
MRKNIVLWAACLCVAGLPLVGSVAYGAAPPRSPLQRLYDDWIADRMEMGIRLSGVRLDESERLERDADGNVTRTFLGSIYKLDPNGDAVPDFYLNYKLKPYLWVQVGWEEIQIDAIRLTDDNPDGWFNLGGLSLLLQGRWYNQTRLTPYAGLGAMFLDISFDPEPAWHNGFAGDDYEQDYQDWVDMGAPEWPNDGYRRNLDVTDDWQVTPLLQLGCRAQIRERLHFEVEGRYMPLDVDLHFYLSRYGETFQDSGNTTFPLDMWLCSIGLVGSF